MGELHRPAEAVTREVAAGRPSHVVGQPINLATTDSLHRHSLSLLT
jgi:hypothetical protein